MAASQIDPNAAAARAAVYMAPDVGTAVVVERALILGIMGSRQLPLGHRSGSQAWRQVRALK